MNAVIARAYNDSSGNTHPLAMGLIRKFRRVAASGYKPSGHHHSPDGTPLRENSIHNPSAPVGTAVLLRHARKSNSDSAVRRFHGSAQVALSHTTPIIEVREPTMQTCQDHQWISQPNVKEQPHLKPPLHCGMKIQVITAADQGE